MPESSPAASRPAIVGTWVVKDSAAPFPYHMYVFNADGTMQQANPDGGHPTTSCSDGKGIWEATGAGVRGKWVEITADRATHQFVGIGEFAFNLTIDGDGFKGSASVTFRDGDRNLIDGPIATTISGRRVTLD